MKNLKNFMIVAAIALVVASCGKKAEVTLASNEIELPAEGGTTQMDVMSNADWSVSLGLDWLTVSPMSGNGNETLTLTATPNVGAGNRTGQVTVSTKDNVATLTVRQSASATFITVEPDTIQCTEAGGSFDLSIGANGSWEVGTAPEWISFSAGSGTGNAQVVVAIAEMTETTFREADVTIGNADASKVLRVVQRKYVALLDVQPKDIEASHESATITVTVHSSSHWEATSEADWIAVEPASGDGEATVTVSVAANEATTPRLGQVRFVSADGIEDFFRVHQSGGPDPHFLNVSPTELFFAGEGGSLDFTVECDTAWEATTDIEWIQLASQTGMANGTVRVEAAPNTLPYERQGTVRVVSKELKVNVQIRQEGSGVLPVVTLQPDTVFISPEGGAGSINVTANVPWRLMTADWVNLFETTGTGDAVVSFYLDKNPRPADRSATVSAMYNHEVLGQMVVYQEARIPFLELSQTQIVATEAGGHFVIDILSNQSWMVNKGDTWLQYSPASGAGNKQLVIDIDPLVGGGYRNTEVHVNGLEDGTTVVIQIKQGSSK